MSGPLGVEDLYETSGEDRSSGAGATPGATRVLRRWAR